LPSPSEFANVLGLERRFALQKQRRDPAASAAAIEVPVVI
jgi:hypothetical protein